MQMESLGSFRNSKSRRPALEKRCRALSEYDSDLNGEDCLMHSDREKYARRKGQTRFKQKQTVALPGLMTLTRCLRKYVESNASRFRVVENSGKSHRICTVVLRDPVEAS